MIRLPNCITVKQESRERLSVARDAFVRRNGDQLRHRTSEDVPSSKDVVGSNLMKLFESFILYLRFLVFSFVTMWKSGSLKN